MKALLFQDSNMSVRRGDYEANLFFRSRGCWMGRVVNNIIFTKRAIIEVTPKGLEF